MHVWNRALKLSRLWDRVGKECRPLIIGCNMLDFIFVVGTVAVFLLSIGYAVVCDRL